MTPDQFTHIHDDLTAIIIILAAILGFIALNTGRHWNG